ncbi:MAG: metallophosphoesterase [Candidatus Electronema sp. V4]|uniref:metallophosphoesterase n=1 Tax=Candidatus Electronema sp. V4 TaxID=3454756 RepID=UPI0040559A7D
MSDLAATCVVGDIHGCSSALDELLALVEDRAESFVFLGDYIDRGPDSKGVIDSLLAFRARHARTVTLMGNHEMMLLEYLQGHDEEFFLTAGGSETLASYGISPEADPESVAAQLPAAHLDFLNELPILWEDQHGLYVHAGLEPGVHPSRQAAACCLWIRDEFIRSMHRFEKPVIFGHTVFKKPLVQRNKIGIDTGAVYGGRLTALLLPEKEFVSVKTERQSNLPEFPADQEGQFQGRAIGLTVRKLLRFFR